MQPFLEPLEEQDKGIHRLYIKGLMDQYYRSRGRWLGLFQATHVGVRRPDPMDRIVDESTELHLHRMLWVVAEGKLEAYLYNESHGWF